MAIYRHDCEAYWRLRRLGDLKMRKTDLFDTSGPSIIYHPAFVAVRKSTVHKAARELMNRAFLRMGDPDGNFVEQFQSAGFHARLFELCCYNFLIGENLRVLRSQRLDFITEGPQGSVCLEATTSNSSQDPFADISVRAMRELNEIELKMKVEEELPIRMGSALFSKLEKRYWELDSCKGKPIVLIVGPFHEAGSMFYTHASIASYLYGIRQSPSRKKNGDLLIRERKIYEHTVGNKIIPSNFFGQPNSEYISGVIYANAFTVPKFVRLAIQFGLDLGTVNVVRKGVCLDPDPQAAIPLEFSYDVRSSEAPPEDWGQGASLFLNPNAMYPIPEGYFRTIMVSKYDGKNVMTHAPSEFWPLVSMTYMND